MDDEAVQPDEPSLDDIKVSIRRRHEKARERLVELRATRDTVEAAIRVAVAEEKEAARMLRALEPRKRGSG